MSDTEAVMYVPVAIATELKMMREQIAALTKAVKPALADADWLSVTDAAKKFKVSQSSINRWVQEGRLEAKGSGASRRVRERD